MGRADEKRVYDQHENDPADAGYRRFLDRLAQPLLGKLTRGMAGLDYGCGPGPTLSVMLEEAGMRMAVYDPYYAPDRSVLGKRYDFVTCTEVVEHFNRPAESWAELVGLLKPGGWLGVMTKRVIDRERFEQWHYKNDPTHVSFYSEATFAWIAERFGLGLEVVGQDVVIFRGRGPTA
ncbi:MAG: class I SAM-dependent methyltransferase [Phycisphaeraceae bacterium]